MNSFHGCVAVLVLLRFCLSHTTVQAAQGGDVWNIAPNVRLVDQANALPNSPALIKSLGDAAEFVLRWTPPKNADAWKERRPQVEHAFRIAIGLVTLPGRTPLNARITARHDRGEYLIENALFESRPGFLVTANLYRPKSVAGTKRPAILCPVGHYLSAGKTATDVQARCAKLVQMGFIVLVYDAIGQGERMRPGNIHHEAGYALLPLGETIAGWMVWDSMRAIDYLASLDEVDPARIGVTGNSGGGLNTLFTAALDERVHAAVVVGFTFEFNNWLKYGGAHCTCTHLPGLFRGMEWFEIAGLIAPRSLAMLHGANDNIFPISGARRAGKNTEAIYALLGCPEQARFMELPGQPHAYSKPYREKMYGWMALHLQGRGAGEAIPEGNLELLPERDPQLLCDPDGSLIARSATVVEVARKQALDAVARMPIRKPTESRASLQTWVEELTAAPERQAHYLAARTVRKTKNQGGLLETLSFLSEDGECIPALLWLPELRPVPASVVIIVADRGKATIAESGLVQPLIEAGYAVFSPDLRGRGETLGHYGPGYDTNFRLLANQTLFGQPLAGRRAFDLRRAVDYLSTRAEVRSNHVAAVGIGDDALPVLLAAASDERIDRVALANYFHSFISQMRARTQRPGQELSEGWNDPQLRGHIDCGDYAVDFGSVIPSALRMADVPDIAALIAPRKVLFCQARDEHAPDAEPSMLRIQQVVGNASSPWMRYVPAVPLEKGLLLEWLQYEAAR